MPSLGRTLLIGFGFILLVFVAGCTTGRSDSDVESGFGTLQVSRAAVEHNETEVPPNQIRSVAPGDRIRASARGLGIVEFPGAYQIRLLKSSSLIIPAEADEEPGHSRLDLESGHLHVALEPQAGWSLVVQAGDRTLRTLEPATEFTLCRSLENKFCMYVVSGRVAWDQESGESKEYGARQGTFAEPGMGPGAARCDTDNIFDAWLDRSLAGDNTETLSAIVATIPEGNCGAEPEFTEDSVAQDDAPVEDAEPATLPPADGMVHVSMANPTIGTDLAAERPDVYRESERVDGPVSFYVDALAVSNRDFRAWVQGVARNDPEEWKRLVPHSWQEGFEGIETQADYRSGEDDLAVTGIRWDVAAEYCEGQGKNLVTETEWEIAATNGLLDDLVAGAQDWVSEPEGYHNPPPPGERILRGSDNTLQLDLYYRLSVIDTIDSTATRRGARIRCAADQVADGPSETPEYANQLFDDEFTNLVGGWPEGDDELSSTAYHPPDVYHLEPRQEHTRMAVTRDADAPLRDVMVEVDVFVERARTSEDTGNYRFGIIAGSRDDGFIELTVQPDEGERNRHDWCLVQMDPALVAMLADGRDSAVHQEPSRAGGGHYGEFCAQGIASGPTAVADIDTQFSLGLRISDGMAHVSFDGIDVGSGAVEVPVTSYGFFAQTFHKDVVHIHFDRITVSTP